MMDRISRSNWTNTARRGLAVALLGTLALLAACDEDSNLSVEQLMSSAQEFYQKGQYRAGIVQVKNVIQQEPQNKEARLLIGEMFLAQGNSAASEIELRRAAELGVPKEVMLAYLGKALLTQGKYDDTLKFAVPGDYESNDLKAVAHTLVANAYLGKKEPEKARQEFATAMALKPTSADALVGLARIALRSNEMPLVNDLLARAKQSAPDDIEVMVLDADTASIREDFDTALALYRKIAEKRPENIYPQVGLARALIGTKQYDEAIVVLDGVLKQAKGHLDSTYLRALVAYYKKDFETAESMATKVLGRSPNHVPSLLTAGSAALELKHYESAAKYLGAFVAAEPGNVEARKRYAATLMVLGEGNQALEALEKLSGEAMADSQTLSMLGVAAVQSAKFEKGIDYLRKVVELQPDDPAVRAKLGAAYIRMGRIDEGAAEMRKALEIDPKYEKASVALVFAYLGLRKPDQAIEVAKMMEESQPDNPRGAVLIGIAHMMAKEFDASRVALERALKIDPKSVDALINMSSLEIEAKNPEKSREYLMRAHEAAPKNYQVMVRLAYLEIEKGDNAKAQEWLEKAVAANPDRVAPRLALARLFLDRNEPEKALNATREVLSENQKNPALLRVIGQAYMAAGQPRDAAIMYRNLVQNYPKSLDARFLLAGAYRAAKDENRYEEELRAVLGIDPKNMLGRLALSRMYTDRGDFAKAQEIADELRKENPDQAPVYELEGRILTRKGEFAKAVPLFQKAVELSTVKNRELVRLLAGTQTAAGDAAGANATLEAWLKEFPDDAAVRLSLASNLLAQNRLTDAEAQFAHIVKALPTSWIARNNLAWVLLRQGKTQQALAQVEEALKLVPDSAEVLDTAGLIHLARNENDRAIEMLRRAAAKRQRNQTINFHLARALAAGGINEEAASILRAILANENPFAERADAQQLLQKLGG